MCTTCGCSDEQDVSVDGKPPEASIHTHHHHQHGHDHHHAHDHAGADHMHGPAGEVIPLEEKILAKNDHIAGHNREWFQQRGILAINLLGSPGAGKTRLLERTLRSLSGKIPCTVIEGDQATANDADRIRATGAPAVQIKTGPGCHLEADMLASGLQQLLPPTGSVLFIENVGNLVCPALFDLGEAHRVVLLSVTEGEDKPVKYPHMFRSADVLLLHKVDLLPHLEFDVERCIAHAREVNPDITVISLSSASDEGQEAWLAWLLAAHSAVQPDRATREVTA